MGDGNAFDRHSTYNPDRDADMLGDFSSDLFSPYTSQDSSQLPTYHPEWSSPNATFPTGERVGPNVHPISEKLYQPLQGSWAHSSLHSTQEVGTNPAVVNHWPSMPQIRRHPHRPYGFHTNSPVADQPSNYSPTSSSAVPFQGSSYYLGRMQDSNPEFGSVSQYATPNVFDAPYMFASNQEASSSSLQPTAGESWNIPVPELEVEPTSPSESGSQRSTPGGSSAEYSGLPGPYMGPLNLGKLTACQHCRRRKIRCERVPGNDRCQQCIRRNLPECISDESKRGKWVRKKSKKDNTAA